jgi:hypothetical protein
MALSMYKYANRSQWPRGLRRRSAAECLLGCWVRIPPGAWMFVSRTVFVLSGRGLCDGPIPRPEESYRLWCVSECDREAWIMRGPWPTRACCAMKKNTHGGFCAPPPPVLLAKLGLRLHGYKGQRQRQALTARLFDRVEARGLWNYDGANVPVKSCRLTPLRQSRKPRVWL